MPEKIASAPTHDKTPKSKRKGRTDEPLTEFKAKLNKWGFIHVPKKALPSLPFSAEEPLAARVEGGHLIIVATTEKPLEKARPKTEKT